MGQTDVLAAFRDFVAREHRSPKLRELQAELGGTPSRPTLCEQLGRLVERGGLVRDERRRMLRYRLPEQPSPMAGLPTRKPRGR